MESNQKQVEQMVAWLDEERRKDKALITRLEERTASQAALIEDQARRIQSLEGELAALRTKQLSVSMFDEAMTRLRNEVMEALNQLETRREAVDQDLRKMREMDREATAKALEEIQQEMIRRMEREMQPHRAEAERLSRVAVELQNFANDLNRGLEEFERKLTYLEEQRRQDARRLSDVNSQIVELGKRVEDQQAKLTLLEELSRRNERLLEEMSGMLQELKQERKTWMEQEALAAHQREQVMNDMLGRIESFAEQMDAFTRQIEGWADTHRAMKKQVEDFDRLADRVDRRLNEVTELQRLSEDRFRQEWEEFLQDDQKRWRQFTLTNEEAWRTNEKQVEEMLAQLAQLHERSERLDEHVKRFTRIQQEALKGLTESLQVLREQWEALG
ncbi:MAG TPA: hypothetical protein ENI95_05015 [Chloroflexi bacterium]|nr:hypothetical protein [Chloroflexota bacterium]